MRRLLALPAVCNLIAAGSVCCRWLLPDHSRVALCLDAVTLLSLAAGTTLVVGAIMRRWLAGCRPLDQYHLLRRIGTGGMGEVYLAEHSLLKRPCAVKFVRSSRAGDQKTLTRFEREVRLTATLSHPNTIEVYDYGRTADGTYYYVMEYLPGLSLEELVVRHGPLPPGRVVYLLRQVCLALREAHGVGLVHRDLKPSNVMASRRGGTDDVAKLLDFGLVRSVGTEPAADLTTDGHVAGTPLFMSPEQITSEREVDGRSDIYSLGAVAYYLLTGRPPFDRPGGMAVMAAHVSEFPILPSRIVAGIPGDLERVVMRCLAKTPFQRFTDAEGLERALGECRCARDWDADRAAQWWRVRGSAVLGTPGREMDGE